MLIERFVLDQYLIHKIINIKIFLFLYLMIKFKYCLKEDIISGDKQLKFTQKIEKVIFSN